MAEVHPSIRNGQQSTPENAKEGDRDNQLDQPQKSKYSELNGTAKTHDKKKKLAAVRDNYWNYLSESGIQQAFEIVFTEIVAKKIPQEKVFQYTAERLRDISRMINPKQQ